MSILWAIIIGFIVGLIARAVMPGSQRMGFILTTLLGVAGSLAATFLGQAMGWYVAGEPAGFMASLVGALIVLGLYSLVRRKA